MVGKRFWREVTIRICRSTVDQKIFPNHSSSLRFQDKVIFTFYEEIQDGRQKWQEKDFRKNSPVKTRQPKVAGKRFGENSLVDSAATLWVKKFVKIALALSISKMNTFLCLHRNSRWPPKVAGKRFWRKLASRICRSPGIKNFVEIAVALSVPKINTFYTEIQDGHQKWQKNDFREKSTVELNLYIGEPMQICIHRKDNSPKPVNHHLTLKEGPKVNSNIRRFQAQDFV